MSSLISLEESDNSDTRGGVCAKEESSLALVAPPISLCCRMSLKLRLVLAKIAKGAIELGAYGPH